jgi:hypothetical protein
MRYNNVFILVVSAIVLLVMGVSCKDKKPSASCTNPQFCQSVLVAKDFFAFKMGSWWVYEEETSHERDSMYVTLYNNDNNSYLFECHIKSSLTDYDHRYWPEYYGVNGCSTVGFVNKKCLYVTKEKGKFQDNLGESTIFFVNYQVGDHLYTASEISYCPDDSIVIGHIYDSLIISAYKFHNVVRVDESCSYQEGKQPTKFYYTKSVGIIRKELIDSNQVWNLVNYHIEP